MLRTAFLTLSDSLKVDITLDPATAAAWLLLSPDGKQVNTQSFSSYIDTIHTDWKVACAEAV